MKKILFAVMAFALLAGVSSCKKELEGKYAPKEKIQSVYQEYAMYYDGEIENQEAKFKSEEWTWVKDRLDRIVYFDQTTYEVGEDEEPESEYVQLYVQLFSYDSDGRLTKSEIIGMANMEATCEYDGKELSKMTIKEDGEMVATYQFNHDGKRITSFDMTLGGDYWEMDEKVAKQFERVNPLRFVLSAEPAAEVMSATKSYAKSAAKAGSKANTTIRFNLEWNGDNVSRIAASYMGETMQYNFNYDTKNNPFYNLFEVVHTVDNNFMPFMPLSKNNVTAIAILLSEDGDTEAETETMQYSYTYNDKDYPTSRKEEETFGDSRFERTYYYEYK